MICVTVEIFPGGFEPARRVIGSLRISNLSELAPLSNYGVAVLEAANHLTGSPARIGGCHIEDHDRHQSIWALVERAAAAALTAELVDM